MDSANIKSRDSAASLRHRLHINNTIDVMNRIEGGYDIRKYSASARQELMAAGDIEIMTKDGKQIISIVPKLALVVISSTFSDYLQANPNATSINIPDELQPESVLELLRWITAILRTSNGKFGVSVPKDPVDLIDVHYTAQVLGMELYVRHFVRAYKTGLRGRTPDPYELKIIAAQCHADKDDMVDAVGERMAYLLRVDHFDQDEVSRVHEMLERYGRIKKAVQEADARAEVKRAAYAADHREGGRVYGDFYRPS